jgi:hypothetical protein
MRINIFLIIFLLQIALTFEYMRKTCKSNTLYLWLLYITHHLLDVFLFWSFLFLTTKAEFSIHLISLIIMSIHWISYGNKCILTVFMNRECGYPEEKWLDSLKNMLGIRNISEYFHFIWVFILAAQDIYMIYFR